MWGKGLKGRGEFLKVEYVAGRRSKDPETRCRQKVYIRKQFSVTLQSKLSSPKRCGTS